MASKAESEAQRVESKLDFNQLAVQVEDSDYERLIPAARYTSKEWLQREYEKLWFRVWQWACREEDIPTAGDFYEYRIGNQSVLIVRNEDGGINAFHNSCMHRGTKLAEGGTPVGGAGSFRSKTPDGGSGTLNANRHMFKGKIQCSYHGWGWNLNGEIMHLPGAKDFAPACVQKDSIALRKVKVDSWGGFIFINLDPGAGPLREYLTAPVMQDIERFEPGKMRIFRHLTTILPCNWKFALDMFMEAYHVWATHVMDMHNVGDMSTAAGGRAVGRLGMAPPPPDFISSFVGYKQLGRHTHMWETAWQLGTGLPMTTVLGDLQPDPVGYIREAMEAMVEQARVAQYELDHFNNTYKTRDDLPLDMRGPNFMVRLRREACAAKGIDLSHLTDAEQFGFPTVYRIFPNVSGPPAGNSYGLFRTRPNGDDPNSCIWDMYFMFRYPQGETPKSEVIFFPDWRDPPKGQIPPSFMQDLLTTPLAQAGMQQMSFPGHRLNRQEQLVMHAHKMLDVIVGRE